MLTTKVECVRLPCHYCGDPSHGRDHIIPRLVLGPDGGWNRVPACSTCDGRKGSRSYEEFTKRAELPPQCHEKGFRTSEDWAHFHGKSSFSAWRAEALAARTMLRRTLTRRDRQRLRAQALASLLDEKEAFEREVQSIRYTGRNRDLYLNGELTRRTASGTNR
jgi:HNH endonuclease